MTNKTFLLIGLVGIGAALLFSYFKVTAMPSISQAKRITKYNAPDLKPIIGPIAPRINTATQTLKPQRG